MPAGVSTIRGGGVALALGQEQALDRDAAEGRQVDDVGVLDAVAEAPAGRDERVLQGEGTDLNGEIHVSKLFTTEDTEDTRLTTALSTIEGTTAELIGPLCVLRVLRGESLHSHSI